jgi:hypothetical protein
MFGFGAMHDVGKSSSPPAIGTAAIVLKHQHSMANNQNTVNVRVGKAVKPSSKSAQLLWVEIERFGPRHRPSVAPVGWSCAVL